MARVIHFDIVADDPDRAILFYIKAFGWRIDKWDGPMEYWLINTGDPDEPGIGGGLARRTDEGLSSNLTLGVESLENALMAVERAGGSLIRPKSAIPGVGWIASIRDTEGNIFSLMQEDSSAG